MVCFITMYPVCLVFTSFFSGQEKKRNGWLNSQPCCFIHWSLALLPNLFFLYRVRLFSPQPAVCWYTHACSMIYHILSFFLFFIPSLPKPAWLLTQLEEKGEINPQPGQPGSYLVSFRWSHTHQQIASFLVCLLLDTLANSEPVCMDA